jgi:hypothetical protein
LREFSDNNQKQQVDEAIKNFQGFRVIKTEKIFPGRKSIFLLKREESKKQ